MPTESANPLTDVKIAAPTSQAAAFAAGRGYTRKKRLLLILLGIHIVFSLFAVAPGHLSVDEGIYHMMSESFATNGSLAIWNGYEEFPSPELALLVARPVNGQLFPQYPHVYTFLAAPFYAVMGYRGLFLLNAIAFVGVAWLTYLVAVRLFRDRNLALNAVLIFALATFVWEYSQAAWPHMTALLFVAASAYCVIRAVEEGRAGQSAAFALMSGLATGVGAGVRLDVVFIMPAVLAWMLFLRPYPARASVGFLAGLLPGLGLLAAVNHAKFGTWSPFSYGSVGGVTGGVTAYLPPAAMGALALLFVWGAVRWRQRLWPDKPWIPFVIGLVAIALLVAFVPQAQAQLHRLMNGVYQLIVDLRVRDPALHERGLNRGPGGGMVYLGSLKKSLLQSCPYLVLLLLPLWQVLRGRDNAIRLTLPFLCIGAYVAVYGYFAWHGGLTLNLRYFLPILPFASMLVAHAIRDMPHTSDPKWGYLAVGAVVCTIAIHAFATFPKPRPIEQQEFIFLTMPLIIAGALVVLMPVWALSGPRSTKWTAGALGTVVAAALAWAGLTAFLYDFPRAREGRRAAASVLAAADPFIQPDSLLVASFATPFIGLPGERRVRLAVPVVDQFHDTRALMEFHLAAGRPVYAFLDRWLTAQAARRNLFESLTPVVLSEHPLGKLVQLAPARQGMP